MDNSFLMEISKSKGNLNSVKLDFILLESTLSFEESIKLSASDKWHNEEESKIRHEKIFHTNQELMLTLEHDILLKLRVFNLVIFNQDVFTDNFDCIKLFVIREFGQEDFTESSFTNDKLYFEIIKSWRFSKLLIFGRIISLSFNHYRSSYFI